MADIFISYSRKDKAFATELENRLSKHFDVWIDRKMRGGKKWREELDECIQACKVLILVISPDATESDIVNYEWIFALGAGKVFIPLHVIDTDVKKFPYRLSDFNFIDFRDGYQWDLLINTLHELLSSRNNPLQTEMPIENINAVDTNDLDKKSQDEGTDSDIPHEIQFYLNNLTSHDKGNKIAAAKILGERKIIDAVPIIINELQHSITMNAEIEVAFTEALTEIADERTVPYLVMALHKGDSNEIDSILNSRNTLDKKRIIKALVDIGNSEALDGLISYLNQAKYSWGKEPIVRLIAQFRNESIIPVLEPYLVSSDYSLRLTVVDAIGRFNNPQVVSILISALEDKHRDVRAMALQKLGGQDEFSEHHVHKIAALLKDKAKSEYFEKKVCEIALDTLENIGTPEALVLAEEWEKRQSQN